MCWQLLLSQAAKVHGWQLGDLLAEQVEQMHHIRTLQYSQTGWISSRCTCSGWSV